MGVKAAFQRENEKVCLQLLFNNHSPVVMNDFALKMNKNCFKLNYPNVSIDGLSLNPGEEKEVKLELNFDGSYSELDGFPYHVDCALKAMDDAFIFRIPCSLTVAMRPNAPTIDFN